MSLLNINAVHTFLQIVQNSRKPLEVIREAIANAYDNGASTLDIIIEYIKEKDWVNITFIDNGSGIAKEDIAYYIFGLGNSTKLNADGYIGNKGVGTLLYLKSKSVTVTSFINGKGAKQEWVNPYKSLVEYRNNGDRAEITREDLGIKEPVDIDYQGINNGTKIEIKGFLHRNPLEYHHENLRDFILWFTKMGSFEKEIKNNIDRNFTVRLKGLLFKEVKEPDTQISESLIETGHDTYIDKNQIITQENFQELQYGFPFPPTSNPEALTLDDSLLELSTDKIKTELKKKLVIKFTSEDACFNKLLEFPYRDSLDKQRKANIEFVVYRIGEKIRSDYNQMIKRFSNLLPSYKYLVSERYGIYLAKDFIPVQLINSDIQSIGGGGHGKTQYLGFFNCQNLDLTIDRTGAATIDEELQLKLNNRINKLMVMIDKLVREKIEELVATIESYKPIIATTNHDDNENSTDNNNSNNNDSDDNTGNPDEDKSSNNGDGSQNSGTNFGTETEASEIQEKRRRKTERIHRIKLKKYLRTLTLDGKQLILREPNYESELYGILMQVTALKPDIIHFNILDYNTTKGFDILARDKEHAEDDFNNLFHVELKAKLTSNMNHLLADAKYIICWTIDEGLRRNMVLRDKLQELYILDQVEEGFILRQQNKSSHKVKIIELKDLIEKHFGQFNIRTNP